MKTSGDILAWAKSRLEAMIIEREKDLKLYPQAEHSIRGFYRGIEFELRTLISFIEQA